MVKKQILLLSLVVVPTMYGSIPLTVKKDSSDKPCIIHFATEQTPCPQATTIKVEQENRSPATAANNPAPNVATPTVNNSNSSCVNPNGPGLPGFLFCVLLPAVITLAIVLNQSANFDFCQPSVSPYLNNTNDKLDRTTWDVEYTIPHANSSQSINETCLCPVPGIETATALYSYAQIAYPNATVRIRPNKVTPNCDEARYRLNLASYHKNQNSKRSDRRKQNHILKQPRGKK